MKRRAANPARTRARHKVSSFDPRKDDTPGCNRSGRRRVRSAPCTGSAQATRIVYSVAPPCVAEIAILPGAMRKREGQTLQSIQSKLPIQSSLLKALLQFVVSDFSFSFHRSETNLAKNRKLLRRIASRAATCADLGVRLWLLDCEPGGRSQYPTCLGFRRTQTVFTNLRRDFSC
jgi:hypothetical protein